MYSRETAYSCCRLADGLNSQAERQAPEHDHWGCLQAARKTSMTDTAMPCWQVLCGDAQGSKHALAPVRTVEPHTTSRHGLRQPILVSVPCLRILTHVRPWMAWPASVVVSRPPGGTGPLSWRICSASGSSYTYCFVRHLVSNSPLRFILPRCSYTVTVA